MEGVVNIEHESPLAGSALYTRGDLLLEQRDTLVGFESLTYDYNYTFFTPASDPASASLSMLQPHEILESYFTQRDVVRFAQFGPIWKSSGIYSAPNLDSVPSLYSGDAFEIKAFINIPYQKL